ncbi:uncharacterized protein [Henckelia pumila]|uniref:uncharacterized protein isoform X2 n=1 Tax=Henckelia pumila TaxID=405737 RepID=UPI003C6E723A
MERARHRKSKSVSGVDGNVQIQKQECSRLSMDSRVYIDGSSKKDMPFVLEFGQSTSGRTTGTPMKKLLACELAKEVEPKRRSPSIIAKLMGLEGLPSPSHVHKQQKRLSENHQPKNHPIKAQRNTLLYDERSNCKSPMEQLEFKDVYEDLEASHVVNQRLSSKWSTSSTLMKPEKVHSQRKFTDAKHISADEKFQHLKEMNGTLGLLDSSKTMLLKFLEKPDSLVMKDLHDLQVDHSSSFHGHVAVLKPSGYTNYDSKKVKAWKSARDISTKNDICSNPNREDGLLLDPHNRHIAHISCKLSKVRPEDNNVKRIQPTRIVVLKPNLVKVQNAESFGRKDSSYNMGFPKLMSSVARGKAMEITRQMKDACDGTMDLMSSGFRGYAGDESSYDSFESESDSESEMFKMSSRNSFDSRCGYASSNSVVSHYNIETKKRLSERWKMAHKYQDAEIVAKGRSLGEMLDKHDKEIKPKFSYAKTSLNRTRKELGSNNGIAKSNGRVGISSRDGQKDEIKKNSFRSRSLPPYIGGRSQRRSTCRDALSAAENLLHGDPVSNGCSKVVKANQGLKEGTSSKDSKSWSKKPLPSLNRPTNGLDSPLDKLDIQREAKIVNLSEKQPMLQTVLEDEIHAIPESDVIKAAENGSLVLPQRYSKLLPELESLAVDKDSAVCNQEHTLLQEPHKVPSDQDCSTLEYQGNEVESSESSKEADHFSPISVLEIPFTEDMTSNTDSFERVGAELRELRMQLQLLKMESGKYTEEEVAQESPMCSEGLDISVSDTWESSYILDVLLDSGIEESGLDMHKTSWYTPECPLNPRLFEDLEKKYNNNTTMLKCERKLLFDRMNSALLEIFQQHLDMCPWVTPKRLELFPNLQKEKLTEDFEKLMGQNFATEQIPERVLDPEMKWFDSREEINVIGNEIEELLVDDLILEVFM